MTVMCTTDVLIVLPAWKATQTAREGGFSEVSSFLPRRPGRGFATPTTSLPAF